MRIAIIGARGMSLPGRTFGGFETFISGLAPRLAARGHQVAVYSRTALYPVHPTEFNGVRLRWLPALGGKVLGTPSHTLLAMVDALRLHFDAILVVNPGNGLQCVIPRLFTRARIAMNVDGVEWQRGKWGAFGRWYFRFAAWVSTKVCHVIVADSLGIADLYQREFGTEAAYVPYAFEPRDPGPPDRVRALGLEPKEYYLVVGRLIPENNIDYVAEEFAKGASWRPLAVVGGTNYMSPFHRRLQALAGERVRFLGHIDDMDTLWDLYGYAYAYVHGHSVGGTNPALLQSLAARVCPIAFDVVFNREVAGDAGMYFSRVPGQLRGIVSVCDARPEDVTRRGERARERLTRYYTWERVVDGYESALAGRPTRSEVPGGNLGR